MFPAAGLAENSSPELLRAVRAFAEKHDLGYTIHLSQSRAEVAYMQKHHGVSPVAFLAKHDFLGPRLFAAHCRYVDDADIALLAKSRHDRLAPGRHGRQPRRHPADSGAARRRRAHRQRHRQQHHRHVRGDAHRHADRAHPARRRPDSRACTRSPKTCSTTPRSAAPRAVRQQATIGSLEVGKKADLLVLDTQRIHTVPAVRIVSAWIHNGQPSDIESVMIDGQFVMRDRKILTVDEAAVIAEADKVGKRVWAEVQKASPIVVPGRPRKR